MYSYTDTLYIICEIDVYETVLEYQGKIYLYPHHKSLFFYIFPHFSTSPYSVRSGNIV